MLKGKKILLGITGSIAAYKATLLVRELIKAEAEVKVILTPASLDFVTPVTLSTLSRNPAITDFYIEKSAGEWVNHVELGLWADLMLIAPASANTLAKMNQGISDNILLTTFLSARCPVWVAPAMDLDMYTNASTAENFVALETKGIRILDSAEGELASGLVGKGRMQEPEQLFSVVQEFFEPNSILKDKNVLITAGPTQENIDPVRYIGNRSTGKMGVALANAFVEYGAEVQLVLGPSSIEVDRTQIEVFDVKTAIEMLEKTKEFFSSSDITIFSAAVADYRPKMVADQKIKKSDSEMNITLTKNPDIASEMGRLKSSKQINIGFALETDNELENAKKKLIAKNFDAIVLNSLQDAGAGFGHDTNKVSIVSKNNIVESTELMSKQNVAKKIVNFTEDLVNEKISSTL